MTAFCNFGICQSNDVAIVQSDSTKVLQITYDSENPTMVGFDVVGKQRLSVNLFAQKSNVSNADGTCTASYDLQQILDSPSGELFNDAYASCKVIHVYTNSSTERTYLFSVDADDFK